MSKWTPEAFHSMGDLLARDSFPFTSLIEEEDTDEGGGASGAHGLGRAFETNFDPGLALYGGLLGPVALMDETIVSVLRGERVETIDAAAAAKGGNSGDKPGNGGGKKEDDSDTDTGSGDTVLSAYTSGGEWSTSYNIDIEFSGTWTWDLQQAFITAADFLSEVIIADLADVFYRGKVIDDLRIDAELMEIDGEGGILGRAGPTAIRTADNLPVTAIMEFDVADAEWLDSQEGFNYWDEVVLHEMIHSLGFGTLWEHMELITLVDGEYRFTGAQAIDSYNADFAFAADDPNGQLGVPVETDGGAGTAGGHWDEETFGNELMTGYLNLGADNHLSDMSIAALDDMGYETALFQDDQIA